MAQLLGAPPAMAVGQQHNLGGLARRQHFGLEVLGERRAKDIVLTAMLRRKRVDLCGYPHRIEPGLGYRLGL
jgi:hypothetical protein